MVRLLGSDISLNSFDNTTIRIAEEVPLEDDQVIQNSVARDDDGFPLIDDESDGSKIFDADNPIVWPQLIGAISVGEVTLNSLKNTIEQYGIVVDFKIGAAGGMLICGSQVIVRRDDINDFIIEGPPTPVYYVVRKALYQQFAFI